MTDKMFIKGVELSDIKKIVQQVFEINTQRELNSGKKNDILTLLTRENTAKLLCISLPTLNEWTKQGVVKAFRIGGRVLYKLEDVNNALTEVKTSKKRGGQSC